MVKSEIGKIKGIPIYEIKYRLPELPESQPNVYYIVSSTVLQVVKMYGISREDFIAPDTTDAIRDESGRIIGVKGFVRVR